MADHGLCIRVTDVLPRKALPQRMSFDDVKRFFHGPNLSSLKSSLPATLCVTAYRLHTRVKKEWKGQPEQETEDALLSFASEAFNL